MFFFNMPKYGLIINPVSGTRTRDQKKKILEDLIASFSDVTASGLDTESEEEFIQAAQELSKHVETLVVAGGDGSLSDIFNALPKEQLFGFVPLGTGNALRYALSLPDDPILAAEQIKHGTINYIDLIAYDSIDIPDIRIDDQDAAVIKAADLKDAGPKDSDPKIDGITSSTYKKGYLISVGFDAAVLESQQLRLDQASKGLKSYVLPILKQVASFEGSDGFYSIDEQYFNDAHITSFVVTKIPYYGSGFKIVPDARYDDGNLYVVVSDSGIIGHAIDCLRIGFGYGRSGDLYTCKKADLLLTDPLFLQRDGNLEKRQNSFYFKILPRELRLRY